MFASLLKGLFAPLVADDPNDTETKIEISELDHLVGLSDPNGYWVQFRHRHATAAA